MVASSRCYDDREIIMGPKQTHRFLFLTWATLSAVARAATVDLASLIGITEPYLDFVITPTPSCPPGFPSGTVTGDQYCCIGLGSYGVAAVTGRDGIVSAACCKTRTVSCTAASLLWGLEYETYGGLTFFVVTHIAVLTPHFTTAGNAPLLGHRNMVGSGANKTLPGLRANYDSTV